jgi:Uma2 family endonuclease
VQTLIPEPLPTEVQALLERRRERGADHHDEVWEGVLHLSPPPSLPHDLIVEQLRDMLRAPARARGLTMVGAAGIGDKDDHRVPDLTLLRPPLERQWQPTAAIAVELLSWREPASKKLDFYAAHQIDELVIVDPEKRQVQWLALADGTYKAVDRSAAIDLSAVELAQGIDWDLPLAGDTQAD